MKKLATLSLLLAALLPTISTASSVVQRPLSVITHSSPFIFEGQVIGINSEVNGKYVHTWVEFRIGEVLKGDYAETTIRLRYLGGQHGELKLKVGEMNYPKYGETGVYFVESLDTHTVHPLRGWGQGHYLVKDKPGSTQRYMYTSQGDAITAIELNTPDETYQLNAHKAAGVKTSTARTTGDTPELLTATQFKQIIRDTARP